jgi:hypothetical protein
MTANCPQCGGLKACLRKAPGIWRCCCHAGHQWTADLRRRRSVDKGEMPSLRLTHADRTAIKKAAAYHALSKLELPR